MNLLLLFIEIIVMFGILLLSKKLFGKTGIYAWIVLASIIANIQTAKSIDLFGLSTTLGTVMFASTFLANNILSECYGEKAAKKGVYVGLFSIVIFIIATQLTLAYTPNAIDIAHDSMTTLFGISLRISVSSILMYFIANLMSVLIYEKLKIKFNGKKMWLRNNLTTIFCNCLENFGFALLAFAGIYSMQDILMIGATICLIEVIIALCDTPFLYIAKKNKRLIGGTMKIFELNIEDLKRYENNPRHNEKAVAPVAESIKQFGFRVPIVVDKNNVIIAGHTRYEAAISLGMTTVPCIIADDLTDEQVRGFRLADNKVSEHSVWDFEKLEEELAKIIDIDMHEFGFKNLEGIDWDSVDDLTEETYDEPKKEMLQCPKCHHVDIKNHFKKVAGEIDEDIPECD